MSKATAHIVTQILKCNDWIKKIDPSCTSMLNHYKRQRSIYTDLLNARIK